MNYSDKTVNELKEICNELKIQGISRKKKQELIILIQQCDAISVSTPSKPKANLNLGMSENITINISEIEPVIPLDKGGSYWYQKNKTDIPEYVKILEIHKDGNDYYYTIQMRDKLEKQTIGQYLFNWKKPPLYSLLPDDNRDRLRRIYDYGCIQSELLQHTKATNTEDAQLEWRFEDIVPKNVEDRKRLNCVYRHAWNEAKKDELKKHNECTKVFNELFNKPFIMPTTSAVLEDANARLDRVFLGI
jgi:hypothetical protein